MSYQAYREEIDRLLWDGDFAGAAQLQAMYEKQDGSDICFNIKLERRMDGGVHGSASLIGTLMSHNMIGHLGDVFRLESVAQDGEPCRFEDVLPSVAIKTADRAAESPSVTSGEVVKRR